MNEANYQIEREPLPTKEEIREITNITKLYELRDRVMEAVKRIEVDLEYRSDDAANEDWEHRARGALSMYKICDARIGQRLAALSRKNKPEPAPDAEIAREQLKAKNLERQLEQQRLGREKDYQKTLRTMLSKIEGMSFHAAFYAAVRDAMDPSAFKELVEKAKAEASSQIMQEFAE